MQNYFMSRLVTFIMVQMGNLWIGKKQYLYINNLQIWDIQSHNMN